MTNTPAPGTFGWTDLTVPEAEKVRDFYAAVAGWTAQPVSMGDYSDYTMSAPNGTPVGGICHKRGANSDIPSVWLVYIMVNDLAVALSACQEQGGLVLSGPRSAGGGKFAIIQDPAGATCGLYQAG